MRWVAIVVLLAGCDVILNLQEQEQPSCGGTSIVLSTFDDDADFARDWNVEGDSGTSIAIVDQTLAVTNGVPVGYATARTNTPRDFTNMIAQVEIVETFMHRGVEQYMGVTSGLNSATAYYMNIDVDSTDGTLYLDMSYKVDDKQMPGVSMGLQFNPVAHRFWRIEHAQTSIIYSTSVDRITWTERHRIDLLPTFALAGSTIGVGVGSYNSSNAVAARGRFDNFELCRR